MSTNKIEKDAVKAAKNASKKKKRGCGCGKCLISSLIIIVIICGGILGGGYWAWDKYVEPEVGIGLFDALGMAGGLYGAKEKDNISKPYNKEQEMESFYKEFKKKMFLDESVDIDLEKLLGSFVGEGGATQTPNIESKGAGLYGYDYFELSNEKDPISDKEPQINDEENGSITGNEALDALLKDLDFDFSKLADQDLSKANILEISDKQFAAVMDSALGIAINLMTKPKDSTGETPQPPNGNTEVEPSIFEKYGLKIEDLISVGQVDITHTNPAELSDVKMKFTIRLKVSNLAKAVVSKEVNPFVGNMAALAVPQTIYVSMTIFPYAKDKEAEISINKIKKDLIDKVVDSIDKMMKKNSSGEDGIKSIFKNINTKVQETVEKINTYIPISFVDSKCELKPIEGLMKMLKLTVTEQQFLTMVRDVVLPTSESLGLDKFTDELRATEVDKFIDSFTKNYGIDNSDKSINSDNFYEVISTLVSSQEGLEKIKIKDMDFDGEYTTEKKEALQVKSSYLAMAGLMNQLIAQKLPQTPETKTTANGDALPSGFDLKFLNMGYEIEDDKMSMVLCFDISKIFDGLGELKNIVCQFVPTKLFMSINFFINDTTKKTTLDLNMLGIEQTKRHFETIAQVAQSLKLDTEKFNYDEMCNKLDETLRSSFSEMGATLGDKLTFKDENVVIPNIFQLLAGMEGLKDEGKPDLTDEQLYNVLQTSYKYVPKDGNVNETTNALAFVRELENKFYFANDSFDGNDAVSMLEKLMKVGDEFIDILDVERMCGDNTPLSELKPNILEEELGFLLQAKISEFGAMSFIKKSSIYDSVIATVDEKKSWTFGMIAEIDFGKDGMSKFSSLLPEKIYMQISVDVNLLFANVAATSEEEKQNCLTITMNESNNEVMETFMRLISRFSGGEMSIEKLENDFSRKMEEFIHNLTESSKLEINFEQGKMVIVSTIFDLTNDKLFGNNTQDKPETQELREVIQSINDKTKWSKGNLATNSTNICNELNTKFYLNTPLTTECADIMAALDEIQNNYASLIDGIKISQDKRKVDGKIKMPSGDKVELPMLSPIITGGEMALLLTQQGFQLGSSNSPFNGGIRGVNIINANEMQIVFSVTNFSGMNDGTSGKYDKLLPSRLDICITIDLQKMNNNELCATMSINGMSKEQMDILQILINRVTENPIDFTQMTKDISDKTKESLATLSNELSFKFHPKKLHDSFEHGGFVELSDIFTILINKMYTGEDIAPQPIDMQESIKALFNIPEAVGQTDISDADKLKEDAFGIEGTDIVGKITDRNFANLIIGLDQTGNGIASKINIKAEDFTYKQFSMFNKDSAEKFAEVYTEVDFSDSSYLLITLNLKMESFIGAANITMMPETLDVSLIFDLEKQTVKMFYNNMTKTQIEIFTKIVDKNKLGESISNYVFSDGCIDDMKDLFLNLEIFSISGHTFTFGEILQNSEKENGRTVRTSPTGDYDGFIQMKKSIL